MGIARVDRELRRALPGVLYPRPGTAGVADSATLLYEPVPKRAAAITLPAGAAANTEGAMTTILASASAPTTPYAVTHISAAKTSGDSSRTIVVRVRGIGKTPERWAHLTPHSTSDIDPAVVPLEPWLYLPGAIGIEGAVTSNGVNAPLSDTSVVIRRGQPVPDRKPFPDASGSTNYLYPLNTTAAGGLALTSSAVAWTPGAYGEIVAAVPGSWFYIREVAVRGTSAVGLYGEVTLAMGAAGTEDGFELAAFPVHRGGGGIWQVFRLQEPIKVPGGTRIAAKYATALASALSGWVSILGSADVDSEATS